MSCGTPSFGLLPDDKFNCTNDDEEHPSNFESSYGLDIGYTNPVGVQYFSGFNQQSFASQGPTSIVQFTELPPENLSQHELENYSWSDHSNIYSSGSVSSLDYRYPNL